MIDKPEIDTKAEELGVHRSNVQRDYAFGWLLSSFYQPENPLQRLLILKGGNCFRKAYFEHARYSNDLDFSTQSQVDLGVLLDGVKPACAHARDRSGVEFMVDESRVSEKRMADGESRMFEARVYFHSFYGDDEDLRLRVNLDVKEFDAIFLPVQTRRLIHSYSDAGICQADLRCLKLEELLASKLKALLQRRHSPDLYDFVHSLFFQKVLAIFRREVLTTFLKQTIYEPSPAAAKGLLLQLPFELIRGFWNQYLACPKLSLFSFDDAEAWFKNIVNDLFALAEPRAGYASAGGWGATPTFYSANLRDTIMEGGRLRRLLRLVYDGYERTVEPYALAFKRRKDGVGREYFYAWDRSGGSSGQVGIKTFTADKVQSLALTEEGFAPRYPTVVYDALNQPVLNVDGVPQGTGSASANTIAYAVKFPFCFPTAASSSSDGCPTVGTTHYTKTFTAQNVVATAIGYSYAIVNGWDHTGRGTVEFHRRQLQANQAAGGSPSSESVLGEALNMVGYAWLAQLSAGADLQDHIIGSKFVMQCAIGVVGQATGPYIDIPGGFGGTSSLTSDTNRATTTFFSSTGQGSAFESGTLEQNFLKDGVGAVSTVKLLDAANSNTTVVYDANSSNWLTVIKPLLTGYSSSDLSTLDSYFAAPATGYRVILPQNGSITQGSWQGHGYLKIHNDPSGSLDIGYIISPTLKGGYPTSTLAPALVTPAVTLTTPYIPPPIQMVSKEPIDLSSGAYLYDHDDIAIGNSGFPFGLAFHRSYTSSNRYASGSLGLGWSHNLVINATKNSDGLKGLGQDSPIAGAAAIAAAYVAQDLLSDATKPLDKVMVASLVQKWFMDRLINNTVNVTMGSQSEQFVLLADGSYQPQLASSSRLSLNGGTYIQQYKDGTALNFNSDGNIARWQNPAGVSVGFGYNAATPPLLTSVSNNFGRSLTLSYNGSNQLSSVADSSGRSVTYTYDAAGNMASFADPLGNTTTYAYAAPNGVPTPGLLGQIFYPSQPGDAFVTNIYDTLGRVASQSNAANVPGINTTWNYYFAGYRSEEDDAYGVQHVLYYNPRGKAMFEIQDLAGLNRVTSNLYDGLDRSVSSTFSEGNSISTAYDSSTNPWANNVASVTRTAKPGSPLSPTTTSFTYDPNWNKPASITDALGLVSSFLYDNKGNTLQATADVGGGAHFNATRRFSYDGFGQVQTATDPMGTVTQTLYDDFANPTAITADFGPGRLNITSSFTYDAVGNLLTQTDPRGNTATQSYDAARRLLSSTGPPPYDSGSLQVRTTNAYDADGRILSVTRTNAGANQVTQTAYTRTGQPQSVTDPNGNTTSFAYDLDDRQTSVTQPASLNRITRFTYDALGRLATVIDNNNVTSEQYTYTANGLPATFIDARGNTTKTTYDGFDRLSQTTYAFGTGLASNESFTYDADDNLKTRVTRKADTITFAYDTLNRLITKTPPSSPVVTYSYDLVGRITGISDNSSAITPAVPPTGTSVL